MGEITLARGQTALVDEEFHEMVSQFKWYLLNGGYAVRTVHLGMMDGKQVKSMVYLHKFIMPAPEGMVTDHINGNKLDCRVQNLRIISSSQNNMNRSKSRGKSSLFKGVCWDKSRSKWISVIKINSKAKNLGRYETEIEAARAYNSAAIDMFGQCAHLNQI